MNVSKFAKRVGMSAHTIRYYDKIGLIRNVQRQANGHRAFSEQDVKWVAFVQRLKSTGMSLEAILAYAELREKGHETLLARKEMLVAHSKTLINAISIQQQHLEKLNEKIGLYSAAIEGEITLD